MLNYKDKIKAILAVMEEKGPHSELLAPNPWWPLRDPWDTVWQPLTHSTAFFIPDLCGVILSLQLDNKHLESIGCPSNTHCHIYSNQLRTTLPLYSPHHLCTPMLPVGSLSLCVFVLNLQPQRSCSSSQVQGQPQKAVLPYIPLFLPRFPVYVPTHLVGQHTKEVGANEVGHTGRQES